MEGPFRDVLENIAFVVDGSPVTQYICLRVFDELGLICLQENGDMLRISLVPGRQKVDLNKSVILKDLAGSTGREFPDRRDEDGAI